MGSFRQPIARLLPLAYVVKTRQLTSRQSLGGFYRPERSDEGLTPRPSIVEGQA